MFSKWFKRHDKDKPFGRVALRFGTTFVEHQAYITSTGIVYVNHPVMDMVFPPTDSIKGEFKIGYAHTLEYNWLDDPTIQKQPIHH